MIPDLIDGTGALWPILPPGIHDTTLDEISLKYATNPQRRNLFSGLEKGISNLFGSGCKQVFVNGSFITGKPSPKDYDLAWDPRFVDPSRLDPVFLDFSVGTLQQIMKYGGEYFPSSWVEQDSGKRFVDFFQTEKVTGKSKGILRIINS